MPNPPVVSKVEVPVETLGEGIRNALADMVGGVVRGLMFIAAVRGFGHFPKPPKPRKRKKKPIFQNASSQSLQFDQPTVPSKAL